MGITLLVAGPAMMAPQGGPVEYWINGGRAVRPSIRNAIGVITLRSKGAPMDDMDWAILRELQEDARLSFSELSRRVHLSPPAVAERVRRLEDSGVVAGYHAQIDAVRAGWTVAAFVRVSCYGPRCVMRDPEVATWPGVREIHRVTGDVCSILRVEAPTMQAFEALIERLAEYGPPSSTMILSTNPGWRPVTAPPA
ncbi:Lrp/AsnC family transcriptional regulator [Kitasatospora paranensis]